MAMPRRHIFVYVEADSCSTDARRYFKQSEIVLFRQTAEAAAQAQMQIQAAPQTQNTSQNPSQQQAQVMARA